MKRILIIIFLGLCLVVLLLRAVTGWTTKRLTYNSGSSEYPHIAVDSSDHLHVVWDDYSPGNWETYYKKSTDGGATWTTKRLTYNSGTSAYSKIAVASNGHLHVVWHDNTPGNFEIFHKKSTDGGTTWTTKRITYNSGYSQFPDIAVDSNNYLHVLWQDNSPGNYEIFHKKSTNGGATWTTKRLTYNSGYSEFSNIAVDSNGHLHVVWQDDTPSNTEIFHKRSTDGGTTWTTKRLTYNPGGAYNPIIAADSNNHLHVVCIYYAPDNFEIYYKRSTDGGTMWTTKRLTYNSGYSYNPAITVDSNNHLHVVWYDMTPGNSEIFYKWSMDGGINWMSERLTYNSGESSHPGIAVDSSNLPHVVWQDDSPGNFEIYHKHK